MREELRAPNGQNYFIDRWYADSAEGELVQDIRNIILDMVKKGMPFPILHPVVLKQLFPDNAEAIVKYNTKTNYLGDYEK